MSGNHPHEETTTSPYAARIRAIEALLLEKGVLTEPEVQDGISYMEARSPANGARLVARAWVDDEFKELLLSDAKRAASELGMEPEHPAEFVVVENTPGTHNLIVCTLCSCYPRAVLGRPPDWYKRSSASNPLKASRSPSTTAPPTSATWSSPCARPALRVWARKSCPGSSRATRWSGSTYRGRLPIKSPRTGRVQTNRIS
jgi:hypothetical protein